MSSYIEIFGKLGLDASKLEKDGYHYLDKLPPRSDGFFSDCYSHCFYSGLSDDEIKKLEDVIQKKLPTDLIELYKACNGFSIFHSSLDIRGLLKENCRNPITLEYGNIIDRPMKDGVFLDNSQEVRFGSYGPDHIELMMHITGGKIKAVNRCETSENVFKTWPSLKELLNSEIDRMLQYEEDIDPLNPIPVNL